MTDRVAYWMDLAVYDLGTAQAMLQSKRYLYVGFMCQQTIEKALKAAVAQGAEQPQEPPKTHRLIKLAKSCELYEKMDDAQKDYLEFLMPLNVEARYPSQKSSAAQQLTRSVCANMIEETEALFNWIKAQLTI